MVPKVTMLGCCRCCVACKPRYKRLVDDIFPVYAKVTYVANCDQQWLTTIAIGVNRMALSSRTWKSWRGLPRRTPKSSTASVTTWPRESNATCQGRQFDSRVIYQVRPLISHRRAGFVLIALEAMDNLLIAACNAQGLNLFFEPFLKVIRTHLADLD